MTTQPLTDAPARLTLLAAPDHLLALPLRVQGQGYMCPPDGTPYVRGKIVIDPRHPDLQVPAVQWGPYLLINPNTDNDFVHFHENPVHPRPHAEQALDLQVEVSIGHASPKLLPAIERHASYRYSPPKPPCYDTYHCAARQTNRNFLYAPVTFKAEGASLTMDVKMKWPRGGVVTNLNPDIFGFEQTIDFHGARDTWTENMLSQRSLPLYVYFNTLRWSTFATAEIEEQFHALFFAALQHRHQKLHLDDKGLLTVLRMDAVSANLTRLGQDHPNLYDLLILITDSKTYQKVSNNRLLSTYLKAHGEDYEALVRDLSAARAAIKGRASSFYEIRNLTRFICEQLPGSAGVLEDKEAQYDHRVAKSLSKAADLLGIGDQYKNLRKAVVAGDIPTGIFNQPGSTGQPVNREYPLWEKALGRKGWAPVLSEIAKNASARSTYERDLTPYINFLFRLESYLDRHTPGRKGRWKAQPRFVSSQWELEMDEEETEGTTKRRSALTPVADNQTETVTVPYVALATSGYVTTWCYARHFHIFEEGFTDPESQGIVIQDLEVGLNGRDDYGLCYYTLTGTITNRGYPTFLTIFEKIGGQVRVHFHRVHPCRSFKGVQTPACELVARCYQYMAGNVPADEVLAQQGDLIFLAADQIGKAVSDPITVNEFEGHRFICPNGDTPTLHPSTAKTPRNRLGYLSVPSTFNVVHDEHEDLLNLAPGLYEIRRCRSYENNPVSVWSLTID